jgi:8-hydroxy-5-deazaflavin:NADPH oxidoreductase
MKIAVIGTGNIGGSLGTKWRTAGHDVTFGGRVASPDGPGGAPVVAAADALADADVVLLAVPGKAAADLVSANAHALNGKIIIDATNNIGASEVNSRSAVVDGAPDSHYARAFNSLGYENFVSPPDGACLFFAADPGARAATVELITATGLEPAFVGDGNAAGIVDGVSALWFALVQQADGNRKLAFRVVR